MKKTSHQAKASVSSRPSQVVAIILDCGRGDVSTRTLSALLRLTDTAFASSLRYRFIKPISDDDTRNLNLALDEVFRDPSFSHFIIVDAEVGFAPAHVERLLCADEPLSAIFLPFEELSLDQLHATIRAKCFADNAEKPADAQARDAGTSAPRMLIGRRQVLDAIVKAGCVQRLSIDSSELQAYSTVGQKQYYGFASPVRDDVSNRQVDRKAALLHRWRKSGGKLISAGADIPIEVIGRYQLIAKFSREFIR